MPITRRIFVSLPADAWLPSNLNRLKWGVVDRIEELGYTAEIFTDPRGGRGLASGKAWSPDRVDEVMRRCTGAAVLGLPRWAFADAEGGHVLLPTEFNHYEGALARTLGLPTLVLAHIGVVRRVVLDPGFGGHVGIVPEHGNDDWLDTEAFQVPFGDWKTELEHRQDVFLGYCSSSAGCAHAIKRYLRSLGVRVLDWQDDFVPGRTIIDQIQDAAVRSTAGIFLFTKDDELAAQSRDSAVPRDNVVFEAGYFSGVKGKRNVLIVREEGSKMPADLGGDIYASLPDRADTSPIERTLASFVNVI